MRNIRLRIAYDGTDFCGWQIQKDLRTVQDSIKSAIRKMTLEEPKLIGAGRTDSGVHAVGQVANFLTQTNIPAGHLANGINAMVHDGISILHAEDVPLTFHSQFNAIRKRYRYLIDNSRRPFPFLRRFSYHARNRLDVDSMHSAAQILIGKHDFRAFETHYPNRASSVRTIEEITVRRYAGWPIWLPGMGTDAGHSDSLDPEGDYICIDVVADGFLYNMVRCISGTLLEVGRGKWGSSDVSQILLGQDRSTAGITAPAQGLFLMHVDYGQEI
ncbi:MAG: truA [Planctomycetaceae bacterium]|nr:truA [Planctomycetaceae bacterium]